MLTVLSFGRKNWFRPYAHPVVLKEAHQALIDEVATAPAFYRTARFIPPDEPTELLETRIQLASAPIEQHRVLARNIGKLRRKHFHHIREARRAWDSLRGPPEPKARHVFPSSDNRRLCSLSPADREIAGDYFGGVFNRGEPSGALYRSWAADAYSNLRRGRVGTAFRSTSR